MSLSHIFNGKLYATKIFLSIKINVNYCSGTKHLGIKNARSIEEPEEPDPTRELHGILM